MSKMSQQEFLNTGLLEQYALDLLDGDQKKEVNWYITTYPKVAQAYQEIQSSLLHLAESYSIKPHPSVKERLMEEAKEGGVNIIEKAPHNNSKINLLYPLLWATIALLGFLWYKANSALKTEQEEHNKSLRQCLEQEQAHKALLDFYILPQTLPVIMEGNEKLPGFRATAYFNKGTGNMSVILAESNQIPKGKCLYLWGDVHGEMVQIAKITPNHNHEIILPFNPATESLNFTLESDQDEILHPNVSQLVSSVGI